MSHISRSTNPNTQQCASRTVIPAPCGSCSLRHNTAPHEPNRSTNNCHNPHTPGPRTTTRYCTPSTSCSTRWRPPSRQPVGTPRRRSSWCAWASRRPQRLTRGCWTIRPCSRWGRGARLGGVKRAGCCLRPQIAPAGQGVSGCWTTSRCSSCRLGATTEGAGHAASVGFLGQHHQQTCTCRAPGTRCCSSAIRARLPRLGCGASEALQAMLVHQQNQKTARMGCCC